MIDCDQGQTSSSAFNGNRTYGLVGHKVTIATADAVIRQSLDGTVRDGNTSQVKCELDELTIVNKSKARRTRRTISRICANGRKARKRSSAWNKGSKSFLVPATALSVLRQPRARDTHDCKQCCCWSEGHPWVPRSIPKCT
jgi:hypothetical protein